MPNIKSLAPEPPDTLPSGTESTKETIQEISQHVKPVSEKQTVRLGLYSNHAIGPFTTPRDPAV